MSSFRANLQKQPVASSRRLWIESIIVGIAAEGILAGVLIALPRPTSCRPATRTGIVGGGLAYLAVGCPTCNHIVMLALGATGALAWFAPIQPYLALIALAVLVGAIAHRVWLLRAVRVASA